MDLSAVLQDNYHVSEFFEPQYKLPEGMSRCRPPLKSYKSGGSEREVGRQGFKLLCFGHEGRLVDGISVDEDCLVWFGGAGVFARPASDTDIILHLRDKEVSLKRNHMACFGGAMFRTGSTGCLLSVDNAVVLNEDSLAKLCQLFGFDHKWHDGACGADISTAVAFVVAEPCVEIHPRLHDAGKAIFTDGRLNDIGRAGGDTEVAGRTPGGK